MQLCIYWIALQMVLSVVYLITACILKRGKEALLSVSMFLCHPTVKLITALTGILNDLLKAIARNCIAHVNYKNWGQVEFFPRSFRKAMALWGIIIKSKRMLGSCLKLDPWTCSGFFTEIFHKPLSNIWYFLLANHAGYLTAVYFCRRLLAGLLDACFSVPPVFKAPSAINI